MSFECTAMAMQLEINESKFIANDSNEAWVQA